MNLTDVRAAGLGGAAALAGAVALAQSLPLSAQSQQRPIFRTGVELVEVEVVVLDEDGRPVRGLTADDFTILDRRAPRPVATFSEVAHVPDDGPRPPRPPLDVPLDVADNASRASERIVLLVIDDLNIWRSREERVKEMARRVVNGLGPDVALSVLFASGRNSIEVTEDRSAVLAAIDTLEAPNFFFRNAGICHPEDVQGCYIVKTIEEAARAIGSADQRRKAVVVLSEWQSFDPRGLYEIMHDRPQMVPSGRSYATSGSGGAAEALAAIPHWEVPWGDFTMLDLMESLRGSNVTFYGMDPRQYHPTPEEIARENLCEKGGWNKFCGGYINQINLKLTAEASGGFALIDRDTFDEGIERIVTDLDHYYLLGFHPEDPEDRGWHALTVTVDRPGVTVRHRVGYRLGSEPAPPSNEDPLVALSAGVLPVSGLPIRLFATPVSRSGRDVRVAVAAEVRVPAAALERPGGRLEDTVTLTALAADLDRKDVRATARHEVDVTVPPSRVWPDGDATYQVVFGMDLRPASYQLRVSAESARTDSAGSVYLTLDVPDVEVERLAIVGPTLGFAPGTRPAASLSLVEDGLLPAGFDPVLDRIFTPADTIRVRYEVWRRYERGEVPTRLEVLDVVGRVVFERDWTVADRSAGPFDVEIPLAGLPPGPYRVEITAGTGDTLTVRNVGFAVRSGR
jgi:VWFA-related protein